MFSLEIENKQGAKLQLTQNESKYQVINVDGLTPPKSVVTTTAVANMDGERFKSSKLEARNIVLTVKINGAVEENRIALYEYFDNGQYCKVYYSNGTRNVYCEGYCENVDCDLFTSSEQMQISILCVDPYWKNLHLIFVDLSQIFGVFVFPFSIDKVGIPFSEYVENREVTIVNGGEGECGIVITLKAETNNIDNPIIYNIKTGEFFKINISLNFGETVIINTNKGQKKIEKIVDGNLFNIIGNLEAGSTWFQLSRGASVFTYSADANASGLKVYFEYRNLFKGV